MNELSFSTVNCRGKIYDFSAPKIMGILNLTPDSFSDGGNFNTEEKALQHAERMILEGAEIIDIGPQSTRPGATHFSAAEEIARIGKVISKIKAKFPETLVSVDTFYAETVQYCFDEGMDIINDISGGQYDEKMFETTAESGLPYILMHVNRTYENMHEKQLGENAVVEINRFFSEKIAALRKFGVKDIILDPGFGFGKTVEQQFEMIRDFEFFGFGKYPVLAGISRKSFIYKPLEKNPLDINDETQKLHLELLKKGAKILRVHDVAEARKTVDQFLKEKTVAEKKFF